MKKLLVVAGLLTIMLLVGCAPQVATPSYSVDKSYTYGASFEEVWTAVVDVFAEMNLPVQNIAKDSGFINTGVVSVPSSYMVGGNTSNLKEHTTNFNVFVRQGDSACEVQVTATFTANASCYHSPLFGPGYTTWERYSFSSTGKLEKIFYETLAAKLGTTIKEIPEVEIVSSAD